MKYKNKVETYKDLLDKLKMLLKEKFPTDISNRSDLYRILFENNKEYMEKVDF